MFKQYGRKKRMKKMLAIVLAISSLSYFLLIIIDNIGNNSKTIAKIGSARIYQSDVQEKFLQLFGNSTENQDFDIKKLPKEAVKSLSKEIYLEQKLLEDAKKSGIHRDLEIKNKIRKSENSIIIEAYLNRLIKENTTKEKINNKYLEISVELNGKKEYNISKIIVKDKDLAELLYEKLTNTNSRYLNYKFKNLYNKYSINKSKLDMDQTLIETYVPSDILSSFEEGKKIVKKEIGEEIHIYKYNSSEIVKVPDLNDQYREEIKNILTKDVMQSFIKKNLDKKEIIILDY